MTLKNDFLPPQRVVYKRGVL